MASKDTALFRTDETAEMIYKWKVFSSYVVLNLALFS